MGSAGFVPLGESPATMAQGGRNLQAEKSQGVNEVAIGAVNKSTAH